jgi:exosome complex exonuclease RRP6
LLSHKQNKQEYLVFYGTNIPRPQDKWRDEIDNSTDPFFPRISEKPNAKVPLDPIFQQTPQIAKRMLMQQHEANKLSDDLQQHLTGSLGIVLPAETAPSYPHPYESELRQIEYTAEQVQPVKSEQIYHPFDKTEAMWVDTPDKLRDLARTLDAQKEFAVDLEHHNYRSYQGLTCLMQISTRNEDFIVDCLELRRHMHVLNSSFTNPNIVKILHGADWDILWLQKDFGLYVVNMFDTGQASRVLDMPNYSLAFLLKHYCGVTADKKYQLADWRIRPLPKEMLEYARADTHYLLCTFGNL